MLRGDYHPWWTQPSFAEEPQEVICQGWSMQVPLGQLRQAKDAHYRLAPEHGQRP